MVTLYRCKLVYSYLNFYYLLIWWEAGESNPRNTYTYHGYLPFFPFAPTYPHGRNRAVSTLKLIP